MNHLLKSVAMRLPAFRAHVERVRALSEERDRLAREVRRLRRSSKHQVAATWSLAEEDWSVAKKRKQSRSEEFQSVATTATLFPPVQRLEQHLDKPLADCVRQRLAAEPYWFLKIEVLPGCYSPGWSDPALEKLPHFGLPDDLSGKRVLDIGCAEGFFSFEAERRGAREVIGIDSSPDSVRRFNIVKDARQSAATAVLMNVYDLTPERLGTFDLVLFYGVFYHLKHPQYALERIRSVCAGDLLFQTYTQEEPSIKGTPWARYYPHGVMSGRHNERHDYTVFWRFNSACCLAMLDHVGFVDLEVVSTDPNPFVVKARSPERACGVPPDLTQAPWS